MANTTRAGSAAENAAQNVGTEKPVAGIAPPGQDTLTRQNVEREERNVQTRTRLRPTPQDISRGVRLGFKFTAPKPENKPFADALRAAMIKAGMNASALARQIWGTTKNKRGYDVARNRDRVGAWLAGTSYPEPGNLQKLADALGIPVEDLMITRDNPGPRPPRPPASPFIVSEVPEQPGKWRIQMDLIVDFATMLQMLQLAQAAKDAQAAEEQHLGDALPGGRTNNNIS